jgi:hypothetical protein
MYGAPNNSGIIQRAIELLFGMMENGKASGWSYSVEASFVEVHNNEVRPLITSNGDKIVITTKDRLLSLVQKACVERTKAVTAANTDSSRSHGIITIEVCSNKQITYCGSICLVDLAGSESGATSNNLVETCNINKSLFKLSEVMRALKEKRAVIPYRGCRLSELLLPSLREVGKSLIIVTISPLHEYFQQSLASLKFAAEMNTAKTTNKK